MTSQYFSLIDEAFVYRMENGIQPYAVLLIDDKFYIEGRYPTPGGFQLVNTNGIPYKPHSVTPSKSGHPTVSFLSLETLNQFGYKVVFQDA